MKQLTLDFLRWVYSGRSENKPLLSRNHYVVLDRMEKINYDRSHYEKTAKVDEQKIKKDLAKRKLRKIKKPSKGRN